MKKRILIYLIPLILFLVALTQITFFIIPPIRAVPEGRTIVILKLNKTQFIDTADAMCMRELGKVNLICRIAMMGGVMDKSTILMKLPYSKALHNIAE